jgi:DNA primase
MQRHVNKSEFLDPLHSTPYLPRSILIFPMPRIPEDTVEQVAASSDVVEVIGGYFPLKRAGSTYKALCPFHNEKTPSFIVNPQRQTFHCFGCGAGGSVIRFVMLYENLDFPSAVRRLAERAGIRIMEEELSADDKRELNVRRRLLALHAAAADWFNHLLLKTAAGKPARDYLRSRGLNGKIAAAWKLGYAPDSFEAFTEWARVRGYSEQDLILGGMVKLRNEDNPQSKCYARFRNRVMFPVCNDIGEVIGFSGRTLDENPRTAKYLNSPETALFTKGKVLFGLHRAKRALIEKRSAIVCEGQLDLITVFEGGVENVIAPQGTAFTEKQARILKQFVDEVVLCFDADTAGQKATERSLPALLDNNLFVRVAEIPDGYDPDSLIRKRGIDAFRSVIDGAKDFFDAMIERQSFLPDFATPRGRLDFARRIAGLLSLVSNAVMRDAYISRISVRLEIPAEHLRRLLRQPSSKSRIEEEPIEKPPSLIPTFRLLCLLALRDRESHKWLMKQTWNEDLTDEPEGEFLRMLLERDFEPGDGGSIARLGASLSASHESIISSLLLEPLPEQPATILEDCWSDVRRRKVCRRLASISARLHRPDLPMEEILNLQKETVDLKQRLMDIARPLPPSS